MMHTVSTVAAWILFAWCMAFMWLGPLTIGEEFDPPKRTGWGYTKGLFFIVLITFAGGFHRIFGDWP